LRYYREVVPRQPSPCHANDQNISRLLLDAIEGNQINFIRNDSVEYSWDIIDSLKDSVDGQAPELYRFIAGGRNHHVFTGESLERRVDIPVRHSTSGWKTRSPLVDSIFYFCEK